MWEAGAVDTSVMAGRQRTAVLVIGVGDHRLGLPVLAVDEVLPIAWVTPLPGAPPIVEGVLDVRGNTVVVLDARRRIGAGARPVRLSDRLVVARAGAHRVALHVDAVLTIQEVPTVELLAGVAMAPAVLGAAGLVRMDDGLLVVHDPAAFLSSEESAALGAALADVERARTP